LITNAALRRAPSVDQRHQCDYTFCCPELPSVTSTAAANDNSVLRAVDATSCSLKTDELQAVIHTYATYEATLGQTGESTKQTQGPESRQIIKTPAVNESGPVRILQREVDRTLRRSQPRLGKALEASPLATPLDARRANNVVIVSKCGRMEFSLERFNVWSSVAIIACRGCFSGRHQNPSSPISPRRSACR
jgi:hypothetical protein